MYDGLCFCLSVAFPELFEMEHLQDNIHSKKLFSNEILLISTTPIDCPNTLFNLSNSSSPISRDLAPEFLSLESPLTPFPFVAELLSPLKGVDVGVKAEAEED